MSEKIRYTRKDLKGPDEFLSTFGRTVAWCKENRWKFLSGALGVVAVFALAFGTKAYLQWEENKASRDLWPHLNRAREILQAPSSADPQKLEALEQFLKAYVNMHPKRRATVYARYYLGGIAFLRGNYDLALREFRAGIAAGKDEGLMKYLLRQGVANTLEAKGDFPAAAAAYRQAAEAAEGAQLKAESMLGEARTLALSGKTADAVAIYRTVLKDLRDSPARELVEIQLARME
ncbi:MAG: hypothetical protein OHK0028_04940 [Deltaproteobacteria bacterium]